MAYVNVIQEATPTASSVWWLGSPAEAMDEDFDTGWFGNSGAYPWWIKFDFGAGNEKVITQFSWCAVVGWTPGYGWAYWILQGSNDNSTWIDLDIHNSDDGWNSWVGGEFHTFNAFSEGANTTAYRYYRFYIGATGGNPPAAGEIQLDISSAEGEETEVDVTALEITCHNPTSVIHAEAVYNDIPLTQIEISIKVPESHTGGPGADIPLTTIAITIPVPMGGLPIAWPPSVALEITLPQNFEGTPYEIAPSSAAVTSSLFGMGYGNGLFVTVGTGSVATSPDGVVWTPRSLPSPGGLFWALSSVAWNGTRFVIVGSLGDSVGAILTSLNGIDWTVSTPFAMAALRGVTWGNGLFVAVGSVPVGAGKVYTSPNGLDWTARDCLPSAGITNLLWDVVWTGEKFVAVGQVTIDGVGVSMIFTGTADGVTWVQRSNPGLKPLRGVAVIGGKIVAAGINDNSYHPVILNSTDGITWTDVTPSGIIYGMGFSVRAIGNIFVIVGTAWQDLVGWLGGALYLTSPDGVNWINRSVFPSNPMYCLADSGGALFAMAGFYYGGYADTFSGTTGEGRFRSLASNTMPGIAILVTKYAPVSTQGGVSSHPPSVALEITLKTPALVWSLIASLRPSAQVIYYCILTGANESPALDDLLIPISSFQARIRNGEPSYLSCVIPNPTDYVDGIIARSSGEIIIQKGYRLLDGTVNMSEIVRVDYETLGLDEGARSASATIVGHKTTTATSAKERTVQGVSFYGLQHDGKRRFRASMDLFLRPGDVAIYGSGDDDSFIVGQITYIVDPSNGLMEVTEA